MAQVTVEVNGKKVTLVAWAGDPVRARPAAASATVPTMRALRI